MASSEEAEGRIARSWRLTQEAWELVRADPALLVLALLSGLSGLAGIAMIFGLSELLRPAHVGRETRRALAAVILAYPLTFMSVFLGTAVAAAASAALDGRRISLRQALAVPARRLGQVALWTLLTTVVGVVIEQIASRLPLVASIAARLFGLAWSLASLFAIPILAIEGCSAPQCLRRSASLVKKRWGEGISGNVIIAAWVIVVMIPAGILFGIAIAATRGSPGARDTVIALAALALLTLIGVAAVLRQTFAVALYRYAQTGAAQGPFAQRELESPFAARRGLTLRPAAATTASALTRERAPKPPLPRVRVIGLLGLLLLSLVLSFAQPLFFLVPLAVCVFGIYRYARSRGNRRLAGVMVSAGIAFLVVRLILPAVLVRTALVTSHAMEPTIASGQRVLFDRTSGPAVGDIVAFHPPRKAKRRLCGPAAQPVSPGGGACALPAPEDVKGAYVRRIVAGPGDTVAIVDGHVIRNGARERVTYATACVAPQCNFPTPIRVPPRTWFVLGDNRRDSEDSRSFGPIPEGWLLGTALIRTWPPDKIGGI